MLFPLGGFFHPCVFTINKYAVKENELLYELITKELTSELSEEEKSFLESEISEDSDLGQKKKLLHKFWFTDFPKPFPNRIIEKTEQKLGFARKPKPGNGIGFFYKLTATILLVISLGYIAYLRLIPHNNVSLNEYVTLPGEIKEFVLSDGTKVWLNSKSVLIASEPFIDKTREILLIGEGYFEVVPDPEKPFVIKTSSLKTKVLGTHLNVSAYPSDSKAEVILYEGKVELADKNLPENKLVMKPGQKVSFVNQERNFYVKSNELENPAEWRHGVLRFYDEDLNSIAQILERKFMTRIFISDEETGKLRYTASFDTEPLDKILNLLSEAHKFKLLKTNNGIIIRSTKNNI